MQEYLKEKPLQLVIIGGGASICEGIEKGLWDKLDGKWTIGINYSFNYYKSTIQCYLDNKFFDKEEGQLSKLPLIITKPHKKKKIANQIHIRLNTKGSRNLKQGAYKGSLTGIFSLSLAIYLLDVGEIFLLGYDYGASGVITAKDKKTKHNKTHFYQGKIKHTGVGKVNYYNTKGRAERDFKPFESEKKIKIYNVSTNSQISTFQKINYDGFFKKLNDNQYSQSYLRAYTKVQLSKVIK